MSPPSLHSIVNSTRQAPRWELEYLGFKLTSSEGDDAGTLAHILDHLAPVLDQVARHAVYESDARLEARPAIPPSAVLLTPLEPKARAVPDVARVSASIIAPVAEPLPKEPGSPSPPVTVLVPPSLGPVEAPDLSSPSKQLPHDLRGLADIHMMQYARDGSPGSTGEAIGICLDLFISVTGNKGSKQVNILDMECFLEALAAWPKNRQFIEGVDKMTPAELVAHARKKKLPAIAVGTQEKYIQHLSAFFNRLKSWDRCDANPVLLINRRKHFGQQVIHSKRSYNNPEWQRPFQKDEMAKADAPWKFFGHLIPAMTGSRSNEIGQLKRADVYNERVADRNGVIHDVLCLHIGLGKKRKSKNAVRVIPVPKQIRALGFEDYLADLDAFGAKDLFPGLRESEGRPGGTIESWFNGNLRTLWGITDTKVTFHCFRHTIATLMRNAKTPPAIRRALLGHSNKPRPGTVPNGSEVSENYYEDEITPLDILMELERLPFPELDVAPYERGRFDHYLRCEGVRRRSNEARVAAGEAPKAKRGPTPKPLTALEKSATPDGVEPAPKKKRGRPRRTPDAEAGVAPVSPSPGS